MASVFKKLIRREFGEEIYERYFNFICKHAKPNPYENKELFDDMYQKLQSMEPRQLMEKKKRLDSVIVIAFMACRHYTASMITATAAVVLMVAINPPPVVFFPLLIIMGIAFFLKTRQYLASRFSFVDAQMILVYRSVLEKLCQ